MNDLAFVLRAVDLLGSFGARTWVCGGWGEELRGLDMPREHADVDLLYPAPGWERLDSLELGWVAAQRSSRTRAFVLDGVVVELVLVRRDARGWLSELAGGVHRWPANVFSSSGRLPVASADALTGYRAARAALRARAA